MLYRKKPIVVEAFKLGERPHPEWFNVAHDNGDVQWRGGELVIQTLEGEMSASVGYHYIIKGVKDEIYPCRVDIFEEIYEAVE
jgi:hypothetical protein